MSKECWINHLNFCNLLGTPVCLMVIIPNSFIFWCNFWYISYVSWTKPMLIEISFYLNCYSILALCLLKYNVDIHPSMVWGYIRCFLPLLIESTLLLYLWIYWMQIKYRLIKKINLYEKRKRKNESVPIVWK